MSRDDLEKFGDMKMCLHHIYEYKKGIRNLILCTISPDCAKVLTERLDDNSIAYYIQEVTHEKVNLFFGDTVCLDALKNFITSKPLNLLTPEEDFMLGIMLGYNISKQSERYCIQKSKSISKQKLSQVAF